MQSYSHLYISMYLDLNNHFVESVNPLLFFFIKMFICFTEIISIDVAFLFN